MPPCRARRPPRRLNVTALISRAAVEPLAPVLATLTALQARHGEDSLQGLAPGLVRPAGPAAEGWVPAAELDVDDLLGAAARRWSAQPHAAAALAWKCYSYWVALPAVLGFAAARRVPLMTPDHVLVRYTDHRPFLTLALRSPVTAVLATDPIVATDAPGLLIVSDEAELLDVLRRSVADAHLAPLLEELHKRVRIGRRTLWGSVASGVAYGLSRAADSLPGPILDTAHRLLTALDADDLVELANRPGGGLDIQRKTCCLAFTLPTPKVCTSCCIRSH
ncbi:IucA/IucC family C-terminal-domain containing protein [Dactylosporangium sp. CA-092794]|uniref:IucA/IucC family C-terminal-domain containing protein n=1 Tax=Dactylosporangium sp. CA-092794 TaxID=3239929 RepID=UPI003D8EE4A9